MLLFLLESSIILWTIWTSAEPSGICCHSAHHCMAWVPLCLLLSWAHFATSRDRTRASTLFQSPSETRRNSLVSKSSTLICTQDCHSDFWRMVRDTGVPLSFSYLCPLTRPNCKSISNHSRFNKHVTVGILLASSSPTARNRDCSSAHRAADLLLPSSVKGLWFAGHRTATFLMEPWLSILELPPVNQAKSLISLGNCWNDEPHQ